MKGVISDLKHRVGYGVEMVITTEFPLIASELEEYLKVKVPGAYMIKKKKAGNAFYDQWDGKASFSRRLPAEPEKIIVPVGLTFLVQSFCEERGLAPPDLQELSPEVVPYQHLVQGITLDPIQKHVCAEMLQYSVCAVELMTASGKTEIICNNIACVLAVKPEAQVVVIVPNIRLLKQTYERIQKRLPQYADSVGMLGAGKNHLHRDCSIMLTTFSSACKDTRSEWREQWDTLIVDEAHHSNAKSWKKTFENTRSLKRLWALSGKLTYVQKRNEINQRSLEAMFGPPIVRGENKERTCPVKVLVYRSNRWVDNFQPPADMSGGYVDGMGVDIWLEKGGEKYQAQWRGADSDGNYPEEVMVPHVRRKGKYVSALTEGFEVFDGEVIYKKPISGIFVGEQRIDTSGCYRVTYHTVSDLSITSYETRMKWAVDVALECHARGEKFIISVQRLFQFDFIRDLCDQFGMSVGGIFGTFDTNDEVLGKFDAGVFDGLIGEYTMLSEGLDVPDLVHFIKLDGMHGEQVLEQQKGRVQRAAKNKFCGYLHMPEDTHHSMCARNARKCVKYFEERGKETELTVDIIEW